MPDKQGNVLPPLPDEVFDGEKYSTEVKKVKCHHVPELIDDQNVRCKVCGAGWTGPHITRLFEAWTHETKSKAR